MVENIEALLIGIMTTSALIYLCIKPTNNIGLKNNPEVRELARYVRPNKVLTPHERKMYAMITECCPSNYKVLCQVSFNAFLKCEDISIRNRFNRAMVDYLVIDENFIPVTCIELDDDSHTSQSVKLKDNFRDNILSAALIPTIRFEGLPKTTHAIKKKLNPVFKKHKKSGIYKKLISQK